MSSFLTKSPLKLFHYFGHPHLNPSNKFGCNQSFHDSVKFPCSTAEVSVAAVISDYEIVEGLDYEGVESEVERFWRKGSALSRRKKRRKRRKNLEFTQMEKESSDLDKQFVFNNLDSRSYLTRQEEAECSWWLKEKAKVEAMRKQITEASEYELTTNQWAKSMGISNRSLDKILCNGRESSEKIIRCYKKLVISIAATYQGRGLSLQDLVQEGNIGLLKGARKFNAEKGYKMSTYVYWWIRQAIGSICAVLPKIAEATALLSNRLQRMPSHDEIAEVVEIDVATLKLVYAKSGTPVSIDQALTNQGCMSLQEIIAGPEETTPESMVRKQLMKQELEKLLSMLSTRESLVLRSHYGLNGETPRTFEEIGRLMELSRERVRQINYIALSKLQQSNITENLKVYIKIP